MTSHLAKLGRPETDLLIQLLCSVVVADKTVSGREVRLVVDTLIRAGAPVTDVEAKEAVITYCKRIHAVGLEKYVGALLPQVSLHAGTPLADVFASVQKDLMNADGHASDAELRLSDRILAALGKTQESSAQNGLVIEAPGDEEAAMQLHMSAKDTLESHVSARDEAELDMSASDEAELDMSARDELELGPVLPVLDAVDENLDLELTVPEKISGEELDLDEIVSEHDTVRAELGKRGAEESMPQWIRRICSAYERRFLVAEIPSHLEQNARRSLSIPPSEEIWCLIDCTVVGSATDSCVVASSGLYVKNMWQSPWYLSWREVARCTACDYVPGIASDFWHLRHPDGDRLVGKNVSHSYEQGELLALLYEAVQSHEWPADLNSGTHAVPNSDVDTNEESDGIVGTLVRGAVVSAVVVAGAAVGVVALSVLVLAAAGGGGGDGGGSAGISPPADPNNGLVRCPICGGQGVVRNTIYEKGGSWLKESECKSCFGKGWKKG